MSRPQILVVESNQLRADVTRQRIQLIYGDEVDVSTAGSTSDAEALVTQLQAESKPIALVIVDRSVGIGSPDGPCLNILARLLPDSRRILTADYADRAEAVTSMWEGLAHEVIAKDGDPAELDHAVRELMAEWQMQDPLKLGMVEIVGPRWSAQTHELKEFLTMSHVGYTWTDAPPTSDDGPIVVLPDGKILGNPSITLLATALGLSQPALRPVYDVVVIGGGPAGLSAAVNAASEGLETLVLERDAPGGQAGHSSRIENYPGFPAGVSGGDLTQKMHQQALRLGAEVVNPVDVTGIRHEGDLNELTLSDGRTITTKSVIVATGVTWRRMTAPGVERYLGSGVYYGASTAETRAYTGETVTIVGGANSAGQAAVDLSRTAAEVHVLVRGDSLEKGMSDYLIRQIRSRPNISVHLNSEVREVHGNEDAHHVDRVSVLNRLDGSVGDIPATGLFVFIGAEPHTQWMDGILCDNKGFVLTGGRLGVADSGWAGPDGTDATSMPGVFAIGDVKSGTVKRVAAAVGGGSTVIPQVHDYLGKLASKAVDNLETTGGQTEPVFAAVELLTDDLQVASDAVQKLLHATQHRFAVVRTTADHEACWNLHPVGEAESHLPAMVLQLRPGLDRVVLSVSVTPDHLAGGREAQSAQVASYAENLGEYLGGMIRQLPSPAQLPPHTTPSLRVSGNAPGFTALGGD